MCQNPLCRLTCKQFVCSHLLNLKPLYIFLRPCHCHSQLYLLIITTIHIHTHQLHLRSTLATTKDDKEANWWRKLPRWVSEQVNNVGRNRGKVLVFVSLSSKYYYWQQWADEWLTLQLYTAPCKVHPCCYFVFLLLLIFSPYRYYYYYFQLVAGGGRGQGEGEEGRGGS